MRSLPILLVLILLVGCTNAATPMATPTPAEYIARAGEATQAAKSLRFEITITGKPVASDAAGLFAIQRIDGAIQRPDGALATLTVKGVVGLAEIKTVSLAGQQYFTNPVTRQWQCLAPGSAFDPGILFDANGGIGNLLKQGLDDPSVVAQETIDGRPKNHLRGMIAPERIQSISLGLIGAGPVLVDLWADARTNQLAKVVLTDSLTDSKQPTTWTLVFSDYDQVVDVRAPITCP
jgi:lipoprotein LprG